MNSQLLCTIIVTLYFHNHCYCQRDYVITLKRFEPLLDDDPTVSWNDLRVMKYNRTMSALNGTVEVKRDINETIMIEFQGYEWYRVDYRLSAISMQTTNFCKFVESDKMFFQDLVVSSDFEKICPIKAASKMFVVIHDHRMGSVYNYHQGTYNVIDFILDSEKFPEKFPGDQWKMDVKITNTQNELITGFFLYLDVDHNAGIKNKD